MRGLVAFALCAAPLLSTCGDTEYGTLLVDRTALEAGAKVELVDSRGTSQPADARTLPYRIDPGQTAIISIGHHEVSVEASPGTVVSVSGAALTVDKLEPRALQVTASEASARSLAAFIGASAEQLSSGVFLLKDGSSDLVSRAALARTDSGITEIRAVPVGTVVPDPLSVPTLPALGARPAAAVQPVAALAPVSEIPESIGVDPAKRFVQFFGYCGSWIPSPNAPFEARFSDGSVASGRTDGLGLVLLDDAPNLTPDLRIAGGIAGLPPRPYVLEPSQPQTFTNVAQAMHTPDITHLAWSLQDAARLARPEWADGVISLLSHEHAGIRILAAVALLRYPAAVQDRALASLTDPKIRDDVAYVLGRRSARPLPTPIWTSGAVEARN